jgi:membrane protein
MKSLWLLTKRTAQKYGADSCSQMAAAISYYVLFSVVPLAIVLASVFGFVSRNNDVRNEVVERVVDQTALGGDEGEQFVADTIDGISRVSAALSVIGLLAMAWSSSAMAGSVRRSLNVVWGTPSNRPLAQQKLLDLAMVLGLGLLLGASIAGTAALQTLRRVGPLSDSSLLWTAPSLALPAAFTFATFLFLYRYVPVERDDVRTVWPGALLATVLFEAMKNGFALYVAYFNNYDVVYGSLGAIMLFLLWTYLASSILLLGGELAVEYGSLRRGEYALLTGPGRTFPEEVRRYVRGLFLSHRD